MKGLLTKLPDGSLTAELRDDVWGFVHRLTGTRVEGGYEIEVRLVGIPEPLSVVGDGADFEVIGG